MAMSSNFNNIVPRLTRASAKQNERRVLRGIQSESDGKPQVEEIVKKPPRPISASSTFTQENLNSEKVGPLLTNTSYSSYMLSRFDKDSEQDDNPQYVGGYALDIYKYLHEREKRYIVSSDYIKNVQEGSITTNHRSTVVDYMAQVHLKFKLLPETLYLSVSFLDRFLSKVKIQRKEFQLLAMACLFLAMKYEEMYLPETQEFVDTCLDEVANIDQLLAKERELFQELEFDISCPIAIEFLRRLTVISEADTQSHQLGKYLCELSLMSYDMIKISPSLVAASATYLTRHLESAVDHDYEKWNSTLTFHSGYTEDDVKPVSRDLGKLLMWVRELKTKEKMIRKKYSSQKFIKIALRSDVFHIREEDLP